MKNTKSVQVYESNFGQQLGHKEAPKKIFIISWFIDKYMEIKFLRILKKAYKNL